MAQTADTDRDALARGRRRGKSKRPTHRARRIHAQKGKSGKRKKSAAAARHTTRLHAARGARGARTIHARHPRTHHLPKLKSHFNKHDPNIADYFGQQSITTDRLSGHAHKKKGETNIKPP